MFGSSAKDRLCATNTRLEALEEQEMREPTGTEKAKPRWARRQFLKTAGVAGLAGVTAAAAAVATGTSVLADSEEPKLTGAWLETISTVVDGAPFTFQVLVTYAAGGGMVATASIDWMPGLVSSPTHGAWKSSDDRGYSWYGHAFSIDDKGTLNGTYNIKEHINLAPGGNSYSGGGTFEIVNNGAVVFPLTPYDTTATRISA
jgi:hypothetical protein